MKSWKTTACGILGLIAAAITLVVVPILDGDAATNPNWAALGAALATAAGLFYARDHNVTSEQAGAIPPVEGSGPAPTPDPDTKVLFDPTETVQ